jgi:membrane protein required for colicin V production
MQAYDIFMLIVMVAAVLWGFWKGFAWQIASLASIGLSYFVALNFRVPVAGILSQIAPNVGPPVNVLLAMLILFLGTGLGVWIVFNFVSDVIERVRLKEFDRQVGALFGVAKGAVLCIIITLFAVSLLGQERCQAICNSYSGRLIGQVLVKAEKVIPPETINAILPHIDPTRAGYANYPAGYGQPGYEPAPVYNEQPNYGQPNYSQPNYSQPEYGPPNAQPNYSQPSYPGYAAPNPQDSYQPNGQYDPRYSQPEYGVQR